MTDIDPNTDPGIDPSIDPNIDPNIDRGLDSALGQPEPSIGDDGFTANVMARLPYRAPERSLPGPLTVAGAAVAGSLATLVLAPPVKSMLALLGGTETAILTVAGFVMIVALPLGWLFGSWILDTLRRGIDAIGIR